MNALLEPRPWRRAMTLQDLEAVLAIEIRAYGWPWSRSNFIDTLAAGQIAELLEDRDAGVLGYFVAMTGVDELHLLNLTVAPEWQGRGHGTELLDAVVAHGRDRGLAALWLEVRQGNLGARALYARRGFSEVGLRRGYYPAAGRREDAVVMRLALGAGGANAVV
ncbi:MAG TPA: ribosomal protein S18-alanine N-acetyltransferase [Rubrivivax sp.]|nr:ribosomal protein S18-alanine N-acetyltransferase [Rubrivivax sp.]